MRIKYSLDYPAHRLWSEYDMLDHLENYRAELQTLMTEKFHIIDKQDIPVQYREVA